MPATLPVSYTSVEYIRYVVPEISSISTVTSLHLAHYAGKAQAEMNAKLSLRYSIPFTVDIPILTTIATDLACYYALSRKPLIGAASKADPWLDRFKEARDMLDKLADGTYELVDASNQVLGQRSDVMQFYSNTKGYQPTFDERDPEAWATDQDKLDDLEDSKT